MSVKKMKTNLSTRKLTRIIICTLMIATILQVTAISMVQATQENLDRTTTPPIRSTDDTVVTTSVDPNLNATEDLNVVILENGETVRLVPENITQTEDDEIVYSKPLDDSTIGITEVDSKESSQSLIAPNTKDKNENPIVGAAVLLVALAGIGIVFVAVAHKKIK